MSDYPDPLTTAPTFITPKSPHTGPVDHEWEVEYDCGHCLKGRTSMGGTTIPTKCPVCVRLVLVWVVQQVHVRDGYADDVLGVFSTEEAAEDYANAMHEKLCDGATTVVVLPLELDVREGDKS